MRNFETVTIYHYHCPPKAWAWLSAKFPGLPVIELIVGSRTYCEFCERVKLERFRKIV